MERLLATVDSTQDELAYLKTTREGRLLVSGLGITVDSLTQAQLLGSGLGTANNQLAAIAYLADLADGNDKWAAYKLVQTEDLGAGTKYILKSDGPHWLLIRKTYTATTTTMAYAGPGNNSALSVSQSWAARAALVYSTIGAAAS